MSSPSTNTIPIFRAKASPLSFKLKTSLCLCSELSHTKSLPIPVSHHTRIRFQTLKFKFVFVVVSKFTHFIHHQMSSQSSPHYGSLPSTPASPTSVPNVTTSFLTRARDATQSVISTRRPWRQLFDFHAITRPYSVGEATIRLKRNLSYFRVNYAMIVLAILFLSLLWHPVSMIMFIIVFIAWFLLYFFHDGPLVIFNRTVDDRLVLGILSVITIVSLVLTHVWLNVLVSLLIGALIVGLHAAFRGTEDLYHDEGDVADNGLLSVVGSPIKNGYTRV